MIRHNARIAAVVASTMLFGASAGPALAYYPGGTSPYEILYERTYYDDAEMTIAVGYERDVCTYYGKAGSATQGRYGPYVDEQPVGACEHGQPAVY